MGPPGTFLHEGETLADAVDRSLRKKANVRGLHPRQLHVFDDPRRDDRGWVLSVAHVEVVQAERLESRFVETTRLVPVETLGGWSTTTSTSSRARSTTSARTTRTSLTPGCSATSSPFESCGSCTRPLPDDGLQRDTFRRAMEPQLVATGARRPAPEGVRRAVPPTRVVGRAAQITAVTRRTVALSCR